MITALEFADAVGRKKMADALDVGLTAVSNAVVRGKFPSSWLEVSRVLAREEGIDCPPQLFGQKRFHGSQNVNAPSGVQEGVSQ
ncbi:hypothetical protein ACH50P_20115 [Sulfitobacter sp. M22386]